MGGAQRPLGEERIDKIGDIAGYNGDGQHSLIFRIRELLMLFLNMEAPLPTVRENMRPDGEI